MTKTLALIAALGLIASPAFAKDEVTTTTKPAVEAAADAAPAAGAKAEKIVKKDEVKKDEVKKDETKKEEAAK